MLVMSCFFKSSDAPENEAFKSIRRNNIPTGRDKLFWFFDEDLELRSILNDHQNIACTKQFCLDTVTGSSCHIISLKFFVSPDAVKFAPNI